MIYHISANIVKIAVDTNGNVKGQVYTVLILFVSNNLLV
jgi:hypothetical protein